MARLFLSFLGTNNYKACVYYKGEKPSLQERSPVRFVQEATIGRFCKEWGLGDRVIIFTTCEAYRRNWLDAGHKEVPAGSDASLEGLKTRIAGLNLPSGLSVQNILIPDGSSETEIWEIFRIVFDSIREGDEVVFDITHAFRSIPMLATVILSYARVLKQITIAGIYYGAFEVLGNPRDVDHIPVTERLVPILDLTPIGDLLEWTVAVDRFVSSGDPAKVSALTKAGVRPILKQTKGADQAADTLRRIADSLEHFCAVMSTCRGLKITEAAERLTSQLAALERSDILPPFAPLFGVIKAKLKSFEGDPLRDGVQAVRWCLNHGLIQQGFTMLKEVLVSWVLRKTVGETNDVDMRSLPTQAAAILTKGLADCADQWEAPAIDNKDLTGRIIVFFRENQPVLDALHQIKDFRNDIDHAGYKKNPINEREFFPKLKQLLEKVEALLTPE